MRVRALKSFAANGGMVAAGSVLEIPSHLLTKLVGLVEPVDYVATLSRTRFGQDIMVSTCHPVPQQAADLAAEAGVPLFSVHELELLRDTDDQGLQSVIDFKRNFPGSTVMEFLTVH